MYVHDTFPVQRRVAGKVTLSQKGCVQNSKLATCMYELSYTCHLDQGISTVVNTSARIFSSLICDGYPYHTLAVVVPISAAADCDSSLY